jgi:hypothetical protein
MSCTRLASIAATALKTVPGVRETIEGKRWAARILVAESELIASTAEDLEKVVG